MKRISRNITNVTQYYDIRHIYILPSLCYNLAKEGFFMKKVIKNISVNILFICVFCISWYFNLSNAVGEFFFSPADESQYFIYTAVFVIAGTINAVFTDKRWNIFLTAYSVVSAIGSLYILAMELIAYRYTAPSFFLFIYPPFFGINTDSTVAAAFIIFTVSAVWSFLTLRKYSRRKEPQA